MKSFKKILEESSLDNVKEMRIIDNAEAITIIVKRNPAEKPDMAESRAKADEVFKSLIEKMEEIEKSVEEQEEDTPEQCEYCEHDCEDDCEDEDDDDEEVTCMEYISVLDDKIDDIMGEIADIKENIDNLMTNIPASFNLLETRLGVAPTLYIKKKSAKDILEAIKTLESDVYDTKCTLHEKLSDLIQRSIYNTAKIDGLTKDICDIKSFLDEIKRIGLANATSLNRLNNQLKMELNTKYGLSENLCANIKKPDGDKPTQEMTETASEPDEIEQKKPTKKSTAKKPTAKK